MTRKLTVAHLTAIDLAPPALIETAAAAGFDGVGLRLQRVTDDSPGYRLDRPADLAATRKALADTGTEVADIEFFRLTPGYDIGAALPLLDRGAALGARNVIAAPYDDDLARLSDTLARLAEASHTRGLRCVLEFFPWTPVPDLDTCLRIVEQAGPLPGLLVDALHFDRSASTLRQLAQIPPDRLPFAHLCDAPVHPPYSTEDLLATARGARCLPGEGEIDLASWLAALPAGCPLGVEIPGPRCGGETDVQRLRRIHAACLAVTGLPSGAD